MMKVKQLQTELQKLGFFPAKMNTTRYYGVITRASIEKYLNTKFEGISVQDLAKMLKFAKRNNAVKKLQNELKAAGFFPMNQTATGFYGNITKQAVANT
jgi:peptidoglycan hydrolase-like protein with peptidoglycan-binding domain